MTRRVHIPGVTANPTGESYKEVQVTASAGLARDGALRARSTWLVELDIARLAGLDPQVKRSELLKDGRGRGGEGLTVTLVRHGANHDLYQVGSLRVTVARHNEIPEQTARATIRGVEAL